MTFSSSVSEELFSWSEVRAESSSESVGRIGSDFTWGIDLVDTTFFLVIDSFGGWTGLVRGEDRVFSRLGRGSRLTRFIGSVDFSGFLESNVSRLRLA